MPRIVYGASRSGSVPIEAALRLLRVMRIAICYVALSVGISLGSSASAQDATGAVDSQNPNPSRELDAAILGTLANSRASALDIALANTRQNILAALVANRPQIFLAGRFYRLDMTYVPEIPRIAVGLAYQSEVNDDELLVSECKSDIAFAISAITLSEAPRLAGSEQERHSLSCSIDAFFVNASIPKALESQVAHAEWSICDTIRFWVDVFSADDRTHVSCGKNFADREIVVRSSQ